MDPGPPKPNDILRRCKVAYLDPRELVNLLNLNRTLARPPRSGFDEFVSLLSVDGIPPGAEVSEVHWDHTRAAFAVRVVHEDFEPLRPGQLIPVVDAVVHVLRRPVRREFGAFTLVDAS